METQPSTERCGIDGNLSCGDENCGDEDSHGVPVFEGASKGETHGRGFTHERELHEQLGGGEQGDDGDDEQTQDPRSPTGF